MFAFTHKKFHYDIFIVIMEHDQMFIILRNLLLIFFRDANCYFVSCHRIF